MEISLTVVNICQMIVEPGPWMSVFPYDLADFLRMVLTTFVNCNGKKQTVIQNGSKGLG